MAGFNKILYHETPTVIQWQSAHPMVHCTNKLNTIQTKNDLVWESSCFTGELKTLIMRAPQRDTEATPSRLKLRLCCTWEKIKVITHKIVTLCWSVACRAVKWSDFSLEFDFGFLLWNDDHGTKLNCVLDKQNTKAHQALPESQLFSEGFLNSSARVTLC